MRNRIRRMWPYFFLVSNMESLWTIFKTLGILKTWIGGDHEKRPRCLFKNEKKGSEIAMLKVFLGLKLRTCIIFSSLCRMTLQRNLLFPRNCNFHLALLSDYILNDKAEFIQVRICFCLLNYHFFAWALLSSYSNKNRKCEK